MWVEGGGEEWPDRGEGLAGLETLLSAKRCLWVDGSSGSPERLFASGE